MRKPYKESFLALKDRFEIIGDPQPTVVRPPKHDDEALGPSIFRARVQDVALEELTLPGLYVGRSELRHVSFRGSDLHRSTFNWSDVIDCDFTESDLSGADLRACQFVRCFFSAADLSGADLRGSGFEACVFEGAAMRGTALYKRSRLFGLFPSGPDQSGLSLSAAQRSEVVWSAEAARPGGG